MPGRAGALNEEQIYGVSLKGMRSVLKETLLEIGRRNGKVIVIDCETGTATNILAFKEEFPDRFVSLGVAEQNAISFAFGVAREGFIPIVPLFGSFMTRRACDQIFIQIGYVEANIKLIGCYAGLTTPNTGATHQSVNDVAIMRSIPNIYIVDTCDEYELRQALIEITEHRGPVYLRMIRGDLPHYEKRVVPKGHRFRIGKATALRKGRDVSLIGCGLMVSRCLEAAEVLSQKDIEAEVINCSSLKPLDGETILDSLRRTGCGVTAENHSVVGGMGSAVAEIAAEQYPVPIMRVGIEDRFGQSGPIEALFEEYGLTSKSVVDAALRAIKKRGQTVRVPAN